jgi:hypothetical protein
MSPTYYAFSLAGMATRGGFDATVLRFGESIALRNSLLADKGAIQTAWDDALDWIRTGRWFPLQSYRVLVFWYLDRVAYKTTLILSVIVNLLVMGYMVHLLTDSGHLALMSMLLGPLFFQFRWRYHDPFLAYHFVHQVEVLFILLSLVFFVVYLRRQNLILLTGSLLSYLVCLLVYEAAYSFWLVHLLVAWKHFGKGQWKSIAVKTSPFLLLALANVGIAMVLRIVYPVSYEGIQAHLSLFAWAETFFKQVYAALPLTYSLHHWWFFRDPLAYARACWPTEMLTIAILWGTLWYLVSDQLVIASSGSGTERDSGLGLLGVGLWLLPAPLIALSAKYQNELSRLGVGYLPVYISYFGLMMGTVALAGKGVEAIRLQRRNVQTLCILGTAMIGSFVCAVNYNNNRIAVAMLQKSYMGDRDVLESAQKHGFMEPVPDGAQVICSYPFDARFFHLHSGKTFRVVWPKFERPLLGERTALGICSIDDAFSGDRVSESAYRFSDEQPVFFLRCSRNVRVSGSAVLARVRALKAVDDEVHGVAADQVYVSHRDPPICCRQLSEVQVTGSYIDRLTMKPSGVFRFQFRQPDTGAQRPHDRVFELPPPGAAQYYDAKSITVFGSSQTPGDSQF